MQDQSSGPQIFDLSLLGPGSFTAARTAVVLGILLLAASLLFGLLFTHRGPVHSLAFGALATAASAVGLAALGGPLWLVLPFAWGVGCPSAR